MDTFELYYYDSSSNAQFFADRDCCSLAGESHSEFFKDFDECGLQRMGSHLLFELGT
jgi:hypothetical protein